MIERKFGRLEPNDRARESKYPASILLGSSSAKTVEKTLPIPFFGRKAYDQGSTNACVGYAASWEMSHYNSVPSGKIFDAKWLYHAAQDCDGDPSNNEHQDVGTYVFAAHIALSNLGHKLVNEDTPRLEAGIESFYWARTTDQIRTAIALSRPVNFGILWPESFNIPEKYNGEWWVGRDKNLGRIAGGHSILCIGSSDKRQAFRLINSWGNTYPLVWLPYSTFITLMNQGGEACVSVDRTGQ